LVRANFAVLWEYRFASRELIPLIRRDALLRERWLEVRQRGYASFRELVAAFVGAGVLLAPADTAVERLADLCWLISEFWLACLEVSGQPVDAAHLEGGVGLMLQVLNPVAPDPIAAPRPSIDQLQGGETDDPDDHPSPGWHAADPGSAGLHGLLYAASDAVRVP
jgi:hypothetical protein